MLSLGFDDRPPIPSGRVDLHGGLSAGLGEHHSDFGAFVFTDAIGEVRGEFVVVRTVPLREDEEAAVSRGTVDKPMAHGFSPNCLARTPDMRDTTNFRRRPGGSPNAARRIPLFIVPGGE